MSEWEDIIRDGEVQYPDGPSSEWGSVHGEEDNASPLSNDETNNPEGDQSNDFTFDLELDDDDILDEESESPVFDLEPFAEEFQITDEFENILPVPTYTPLDLETQSSQFKRRLIPLEDVKSDIAKNTRGTQYKNAQIYINEQKSLPQDWRHAPTGIGLRFRIEGGCASRRIIIQLPIHHNSKLVFSASFEIHPCHIKDFSIKDLSTNEAVEQKVKKKRKDALPERESYIILAIGLHTGGIGFGLEYNAKFLSKADKQLLWYMRRLSINYAENDSTPQRIILRINARWIDYEDADSNSNMRRKTEARDRLYNQLDELMLDATTEKQTLTPYRSQQGDPVTQWGQFVTREIIKKESQGLVAFRTRYSFSTLSEYQITFAYASHLEWENEREIADFVSTQCHGVAFIIVNKSDVLALLKLSMPKSEKEENAFNIESWAPREGTTAAISFRPPDKLNVGNVKCYGVCTANIYDLPYPPGSLFHIVTRNVSYYAKFAVEVGKNINFFPARLLLDVPVSGAKRQVDAINTLCRPEPELTCFSRLLLNQQYHLKSKRFNDPLASLDLSDEVVKDAVKRVISVRGIVWSESQRSCLQTYVRNFADNLLIIQGYPGTGKTLTLIGLASIYLALGLHVMVTAPTHYAADAICQGIQKWETLSGINLHPLRVYRPISESRAFRNHGKSGIDPEVESQHGDELSGDEDGDDYGGDSGEYDDAKNIPSSNAVVAQDDKAQAIHPTPSDENTEAAAIEPSNNNAAVAQGDNVETAPDALVPLQDQIMIGEYLKMTHEAYHRRYYSRTDISLEARVFEMASDDSQTLMAIQPSSEQAVTIKGDWFAQIENGNLIPEGDEVDVLALLRDYAEKIKESEYRKLEDSDKKTALWAFKTACKAVIRQTRLLISTNNNTGDGIIASNFGHDATGIIIIRDEDFKELEANSWIPVSKLAAAEKIKGVVSCGDAHQLVPTVMSRYGQPCNEFSAQLALSLPARLLHMNHPSVKLTEQFRYRDVFVP
ncbi:hypothetical protein BDV33DRAFT_198654 [Aspergillus novoparasiticus]|uniref:DNA2/NAM7 helicase helicase domain-containing protein n=1 Tax=Aspergillus novoparasiticus TaxID=986946 RepID=A0A5N6F897_9EURO|nr:hypothetical protein BDV33DRAFT_198654 [Aspergillus novoparasiticus]